MVGGVSRIERSPMVLQRFGITLMRHGSTSSYKLDEGEHRHRTDAYEQSFGLPCPAFRCVEVPPLRRNGCLSKLSGSDPLRLTRLAS